jgi:hypothetical protein
MTPRLVKLRQPRTALRYDRKMANRGAVARAYRKWRALIGLSDRCDNSKCQFHTESLVWLDAPLPLTLDPANGNKYDNRIENLRYLCPACDAQLPTRGGKNKGRVASKARDGFALRNSDGTLAYQVSIETAHYRLVRNKGEK